MPQNVRRFMAAHGIKRKCVRRVAWSTTIARVIYGIGVLVIYKAQQWVIDRIQKVNVKIAKDIAVLGATTAGCDAFRCARTPTPEDGRSRGVPYPG
jgi:hypothetical protein